MILPQIPRAVTPLHALFGQCKHAFFLSPSTVSAGVIQVSKSEHQMQKKYGGNRPEQVKIIPWPIGDGVTEHFNFTSSLERRENA